MLSAAAGQFVGVLLGGWLSDVTGRKPVMITAALGLAVWAPIFFVLTRQGSIGLLYLAVCIAAFIHGILAGPETKATELT